MQSSPALMAVRVSWIVVIGDHKQVDFCFFLIFNTSLKKFN